MLRDDDGNPGKRHRVVHGRRPFTVPGSAPRPHAEKFLMNSLALSVLLSFVSAVAYAGGAIVQERVAVSSPGGQYALLRRPGWWAAVTLNGLGALLHVAALAHGPLSVVQPLGALTIVFALPMAALFAGHRAGATAWRGALMATLGLVGLLSLVGASDARSLDSGQRVAVALTTAVAVGVLTLTALAVRRRPAAHSILLAVASGVAFGMSSVFTKTVAVDWADGVSAGDAPSFAVIGALGTAGLLLSQASYRATGLVAPLATLTVVNPVVAATVGLTMFGETFRHGPTGTALALSCCLVAAGGLVLLTRERLGLEQRRREHAGAHAPMLPVGGCSCGQGPGDDLRYEAREPRRVAVRRRSGTAAGRVRSKPVRTATRTGSRRPGGRSRSR